MSEIEGDASANPFQGKIGAGNVRGIADATRFHLGSAWKIVTLLLVGGPLTEERIDVLLKQLEVGISEDALELLQIPVQLNRGEYLALHSAGLSTPEKLWTASAEQLKTILGKLRSTELEAVRPMHSSM